MLASHRQCTVLETLWLSPTLLRVRFTANRPIRYQPGQFLSVVVPGSSGERARKRCYSFASPPELAEREGYEVFVRLVSEGSGSTYLASLRAGDKFEAYAPYGHFVLRAPPAGVGVCLIGTGTGVAPLRAMALAPQLAEAGVPVTLIAGAREERDLVVGRDELEAAGVRTIFALTAARLRTATIYQGRVTDYLQSLPPSWEWHSTEYYLCGNEEMVADVRRLLQATRGVPPSRIHQEIFARSPASRVSIVRRGAEARKPEGAVAPRPLFGYRS